MKRLREISQMALDKWGFESQMDMIEEEALELALAIQHSRREHHHGNGVEKLQRILEEVADIEIMCDQFRAMTSDSAVDIVKSAKLKRLEKRITGTVTVEDGE